jgi:hypothetical protein
MEVEEEEEDALEPKVKSTKAPQKKYLEKLPKEKASKNKESEPEEEEEEEEIQDKINDPEYESASQKMISKKLETLAINKPKFKRLRRKSAIEAGNAMVAAYSVDDDEPKDKEEKEALAEDASKEKDAEEKGKSFFSNKLTIFR